MLSARCPGRPPRSLLTAQLLLRPAPAPETPVGLAGGAARAPTAPGWPLGTAAAAAGQRKAREAPERQASYRMAPLAASYAVQPGQAARGFVAHVSETSVQGGSRATPDPAPPGPGLALLTAVVLSLRQAGAAPVVFRALRYALPLSCPSAGGCSEVSPNSYSILPRAALSLTVFAYCAQIHTSYFLMEEACNR